MRRASVFTLVFSCAFEGLLWEGGGSGDRERETELAAVVSRARFGERNRRLIRSDSDARVAGEQIIRPD